MPSVLSAKIRTGPIVSLSFSHAFVDIYQGAVAALVPFFAAERAYSYAAASGIVLAGSLLSSVVQPLLGVLVDKYPMRWILPVSTLLAGVGVALVGVTDSYALTLLLVALSGVGVAAYHPAAAGVARIASGNGHSGMSWFSLGGNLGFAAAPLMVAGVIAVGGLHASPLLVIPALAGAALCMTALKGLAKPTASVSTTQPAPARDDWPSFLKLSGAIVCRSIVFVGLSAFIAVYAAFRVDDSPVTGTIALFVLYLGGAFGTVLGGMFANRWQRVVIVRWSYVITALSVAGTIFIPGPAIFFLVALTSAALYAPFALHVTLGQDYLPNRVGTASGVTLGLTVSIGGLATPIIGVIADATSLQIALVPLIALPLVGWLFLRTLSEPIRPAVEVVDPVTEGTR